jgi:hypothetical protein
MGLSAGLDFEAKLFAKPDVAKLLERELAKPGYKPRVIAIGTNTDPYQPIEKEWRIMRQILEVLNKANHPVSIVTKSALILRDIDILEGWRKEPGACRPLGDDARPQAGPHDGAAGRNAGASAGGDPGIERSRHPDGGDGCADHTGSQRSRTGAHPRFGQGSRARWRQSYVILRLPLEVSRSFGTGCCRITPIAIAM